MKQIGDVYTSDSKPSPQDVVGEETYVVEDVLVVTESGENPKEGGQSEVVKTEIFADWEASTEKVDAESTKVGEHEESQGIITTSHYTDKLDVVEKVENKTVEIEKKNFSVNKGNPQENNPSKHGEFFIKFENKKRRGKKSSKIHLTTNQKQVRHKTGTVEVKVNQQSNDGQNLRNDYYENNTSKTYDPTQIEINNSGTNYDSLQTPEKPKERESSDEKPKIYLEEEKSGRDLGADIIVLIIIGVIAGVAGFSYIFTQLGLINR